MVCLRCGHCCKYYFAAIIDDPSKGIVDGNIICNEGGGVACKHLQGENPGEYVCLIHHYEWFEETPCYRFTQVGKNDSECRIGKHVMSKIKKTKSGY